MVFKLNTISLAMSPTSCFGSVGIVAYPRTVAPKRSPKSPKCHLHPAKPAGSDINIGSMYPQ
jgi:hypothetical protein